VINDLTAGIRSLAEDASWPEVLVRGWRRQQPSGQVLTKAPFFMSTSKTSRPEAVTQGFRWLPFSASTQLQLRPLSYQDYL
jgi:hypothetical protein